MFSSLEFIIIFFFKKNGSMCYARRFRINLTRQLMFLISDYAGTSGFCQSSRAGKISRARNFLSSITNLSGLQKSKSSTHTYKSISKCYCFLSSCSFSLTESKEFLGRNLRHHVMSSLHGLI
jgi:hypothetical protein